MWRVYALLSALFAALTSILAKIGIEDVNSHLATALRTVVVLFMAWGMVLVTGTQDGITAISKKSWLFIILSGLATGASWLFYYRALQLGEASRVAPIDKLSVVLTMVLAFVFLGEAPTLKTVVGGLLIAAGTLVIAITSFERLVEKTASNALEVRARGATVLAVTTERLRQRVEHAADEIIVIPDTHEALLPSLAVLPLQLFAYYMALYRGCDIDKPRNLAKSVTVE